MILSDIDIEKAKSDYANAEPFKFCVVDDFLREDVAELIHKDLVNLIPNQDWWRYKNIFENKYATDQWDKMPSFTRAVLAISNTSIMTKVLEEITGLNGLIVDSGIRGGGIHLHLPEGHLDVHSDFWFHEKLKIKRKLNLLMYFNKDWRSEYMGDLELWNSDMTECKHKIAPLFNRMVLFDTSNGANHGLPEKVACPPGMMRKSLALYYYQAMEEDDFKKEKHSTMFKKRPQDETNEEIEKLRMIRNKGRLR